MINIDTHLPGKQRSFIDAPQGTKYQYFDKFFVAGKCWVIILLTSYSGRGV
jgi:hypothetical protein